MLVLVAFCLLTAAGLLEVSGVVFPGLDLALAAALVAAMTLGAIGALRGSAPSSWGIVAFGVAALLLGLHVCLVLGVLS